MAEVNPAGWFQALSTHTAEQLRSYVGSTFAVPQGAQSLKTAGAVHPGLGTAMAVVQNGTPNMTVNVGAGSCWIGGTETTKQGTYFCQNDAAKSLTIAASDPTLNRIDLVVAKVQDAAYSGVPNAWSLVIVQGTASGSPAAPAAPANAIILAQVLVSAAVSSITTGAITDTRPWNAALGGIVPCTAAARPANPYNGLYAYELDTFRTIRYNGTNWHQLGIHVCTAATRPAGPYTGMQIFETDTGLMWLWSGTLWLPDANYGSEIRRTASFTVASGPNLVVVPFDDEGVAGARDPLGVWASSPNPSRLTIPAGMGGRWSFRADIQFEFNAAGSRAAAFNKNGGNVNAGTGSRLGEDGRRASDQTESSLKPEWEDNFVPGDYMELWMSQNSGSTLSVTSSPFPVAGGVRVYAKRIGAAL